MPVYEYQCETCSLRFEKQQRFSDEPLSECPQCGGLLRKVIQPVGVIFKGSGFYVTDNRGKSSTTPPARKESDNAGSSEGKTESVKTEVASTTASPGETKSA